MNQQISYQQPQPSDETGNWRTKFLIGGGVLGAVLGAATAYLLVRTAEETNSGPPHINTTDALRASIGVIGTIRSIAALADRKSKKKKK